MKIKEFYKRMLFLLSVPKCTCCGDLLDYEDKCLCKSCYEEYVEHLGRNCSLCARVLSECTCSNDYLSNHYVKRLIKLYRYTRETDIGPANSLIFNLKRERRADVTDFLCDSLAAAIARSISNPESVIYTNVPRRKRAIVKYGFDHARVLAEGIAKRLGGEYMDILVSKARREQKRLGGNERVKNVSVDYKREPHLDGRRVIIIDDIVTTGSSMGACAMLLRGLGAKEIIGATVAVAYKDEHAVIAKGVSR